MLLSAKPGRHGQRWDDAADDELRRRFAEGQLLREVAISMSRSQESVRSRANILHIPVRSSLVRAKRGCGRPGPS